MNSNQLGPLVNTAAELAGKSWATIALVLLFILISGCLYGARYAFQLRDLFNEQLIKCEREKGDLQAALNHQVIDIVQKHSTSLAAIADSNTQLKVNIVALLEEQGRRGEKLAEVLGKVASILDRMDKWVERQPVK